MAEAVALSKLYSIAEVDRAIGTAAVTARFAEKDLLSILAREGRRSQIRGPYKVVRSAAAAQ